MKKSDIFCVPLINIETVFNDLFAPLESPVLCGPYNVELTAVGLHFGRSFFFMRR